MLERWRPLASSKRPVSDEGGEKGLAYLSCPDISSRPSFSHLKWPGVILTLARTARGHGGGGVQDRRYGVVGCEVRAVVFVGSIHPGYALSSQLRE